MRPPTSSRAVRRRRADRHCRSGGRAHGDRSAVGATARSRRQAPRLPGLRRRQGQGEGKPGARHHRLHQRPGRPAELQLPAGDERHQSRREDGERRARRSPRAPGEAQRVLLGAGGGGRRPVRPADGQRQADDGDPLRVRDRREPVDLRDGQGHDPDRRRRHGERGRPDGEERVLPERQPDERARPLRHLHEAVPAQGEDHRRRLPEPPGRRSPPLRRSGRACSRSASR